MKTWHLFIGVLIILILVSTPALAISKNDLIASYSEGSDNAAKPSFSSQYGPWSVFINPWSIKPTPTPTPSPTPTQVPTTVPTTAPTQLPSGTRTSESYVCGLQWNSHDARDGQATQLMGIAVDRSGNIFVVEWGNHRIQKYGPDGTFITNWEYNTPLDNLETCPYLEHIRNSIVNTTEEELIASCGHWKPRDIAVDGSGNVYISDNEHFGYYITRDDRIMKFSSYGTFITSWGTFGSGDGQFDNPHGIAIDGSGNVYVADYGNDRIQKLSPDGTFLTAFGLEGTGDSRIRQPIGVAVDGSGNVYVVEWGSYRVKKFGPDGTFITAWGSKGTGDGQFQIPLGIAADRSGNVYVAEQGDFERIQKFSSDGRFLTKWSIDGCPSDIAVDGSGNVYVTDECSDRIMKFIRNTNPGYHPTMTPTTTPPTTIPTAAPTQSPSGTGSLSISSSPSGALVYLDGAIKGFTPITIAGVSSGIHQVKLTRIEYNDHTASVTVEPGKTNTVSVTMTSHSGTSWIVPTLTPTPKFPTTVPTRVAPSVIFGSLGKPPAVLFLTELADHS
jgi:sugar lactone lactonase YvrE